MSDLIVPWVAIWSAEKVGPTMEVRGGRLVVVSGHHLVRREYGMWMMTVRTNRSGTPDFGSTHSARQRRAMRHLLCQVCGKHRPDVRWVIPNDEPHVSLWKDRMAINAPVCADCLRYANTHCPHLMSTEPYAIEIADRDATRPTHVSGNFYYSPDDGFTDPNVMIALDDPRRAFMVGRELIVTVDR